MLLEYSVSPVFWIQNRLSNLSPKFFAVFLWNPAFDDNFLCGALCSACFPVSISPVWSDRTQSYFRTHPSVLHCKCFSFSRYSGYFSNYIHCWLSESPTVRWIADLSFIFRSCSYSISFCTEQTDWSIRCGIVCWCIFRNYQFCNFLFFRELLCYCQLIVDR